METSSTYPKFSFLRFLYTSVLVPLLLVSPGLVGEVMGQEKELANEVTYTSPNNKAGGLLGPFNMPTVLNPSNALEDDETYARLLASPGLVAGLGSYDGVIELKFPETLDEDTWSYVRIAGDNSLFDALLGGSLGDLLGDVLGVVLLGNQEITIDARLGGNSVLSRSSTAGFDTDRVKLVVDKNGNYHLAIRPADSYDRIRITNSAGSLVGLGTEYNLDVYNAFYFDDSGDCLPAQFTSFDGEGLSLNLLENGGGATDLGNAIDDDDESYSQISAGTVSLGLGNSIYQTIYYDDLSAPQDYLRIKLGIANGAAVNAQLIGNIEIKAFAGGEPVYAKRLSSGLINGVDVLGLLQNGEPATIYIGPGVSFDRVTIGYSAVVDLNLGNAPIHLYDVKRYGETCPEPGAPAPVDDGHMFLDANKECADNVLSFENANFPYNVIDGYNGTYTTLEAGSGLVLGIGDYTGHIELGFDGTKEPGTTTYVRIDFDNEILLGLLDGSVGDLINGVGGALFGQHYFTVEVKNGDDLPFLTASSNNGFLNQPVKVVQDKHGHYYVAVTPGQTYDRIRITEHYPAAAGLEGIANMNVYHACISIDSEDCEQAFATYSESNGISLDLLSLGDAGVTNAQHALTDDVSTWSEIDLGTAGIGASVFQVVQYHTLSDVTDHFNLTFSVDAGSVADLGLLSNIEVRAYAGDNEVFSQKLSEDVIDLDLLGLLQSGEAVMVRIAPGVAFDRIAIGKSALVDANVLSSSLYIHKIERFGADCPDPDLEIPDPTADPFNAPGCAEELVSFDGVNFAYNATDSNNETFATLTSGTGTVLGIDGYDSHIELGYVEPVGANTTSYIRINFEEDMLKSLLGGTLGNIVGDVLGGVVLGNHYFVVDVNRADGSTIVSRDSRDQFGDQSVKLVQDAEGRFYIAVTADEAYQSVKITHHLDAAVGLGKTATMDVYGMCHETAPEFCDQARFVSYDGSGISLSLDLTDITEGGVLNPHYVIDENTSNYSTINLGAAGVGATIYQNIYFNGPSKDTDKLRLRVQLDQPGLLNLDLIGSYRVKLFLGEEEVYNEALQDGLLNNIDLLALLNSGGIQELTLAPEVVFDRVQFGLESIASINTGAPLRLYEMSRISDDCPDPTFEEPPFVDPFCATELIDAENVDNLENLFNGNHNSYATIRSDAGLVGGIFGHNGFVELGYGTTNVDGGITSFIRIDTDETLLETLLSGSLGEALADIVGSVVLGHHYFEVEVKDASGATVVSGSSANMFSASDGAIKIVQDAEGRYYLAVTPTEEYNRIRITDNTNSVVGLNNENSINVYGLCHETNFEGCAFPFTTSFDGTGLSVDLTDLGGYGVTDAYKAIDPNNTSDYSEISLGALNVAGSVEQKVQFNKTLEANTVVKLDMSVGTGVLTADVFGRIEVVGYKNGEEIYTEDLENAVIGNVNLAQLFNNGTREEISFAPDVEVDEVGLRLRSVASVAAVPNVRLYSVEVDCDVPQFVAWKSFEINEDPALTSVSGGETVEYTIHVRNTGTVPMTNFIITDEIPGNTMIVAASISNGGTETSGVITWEGIDVPVDGTATVSFSVTVDEDLTGIDFISNVALVKANEDDPGTQTWPPVDNENPTDPDDTGDTGTDIPVDHIAPILEVSEDNAIANGVDENVLIATVQTEGGKLIADEDVVFNITYPDGTEETRTIATNEDGEAILAITSTTAGEATVEALVRGTEIDDSPASVTFVAGPVDHGASELTVTKDGAIANGTDYNEVTATITDANGNPIAGEDVVFDVTYPDATTGQETVPTDAEGKAVLEIRSSTAGDAEVTATVDGTEITGSPATVNFVADIVDNGASTLTITKDGATADGVDYNELTATIVDASDNPLEGVGVFFEFTYPDGSTGTENVLTDANGEAVLQLTSLVPGNAIVSATVGGTDISNSPATVTFVACVGQPEISFDGDGTICEGEGLLLTATEVDGYQWYLDGNPITGAVERTYLATEEGAYTVVVFGENDCQSVPSEPETVTVNPAPEVTIDGQTNYVIEISGSVTLPDVTVTVGGSAVTADITWLDPDGNEVPSPATIVGPFTEPDTYVYTAVAEVGNCTAMAAITIVVIDPDECPPGYERIYVSSSDSPSGVLNPDNAVGSDLTDRAEVAIPSLFGTTAFNLSFDEALTGGEALHVKIGSRVDLSLVGSISVTLQALDGTTPVGTPVTLSGGWLVNLLAGENIDDVVLTNPGASYDGVRVTVQGGLLAGGDIDVYAAYVNRKVTELADCEEVSDILTGSTSGALGALNGVTNEWAVTNDDLSDFAVIRQNVGALGYVHLTTIYPSVAQSGDSVRIVMKRSDGGLIDAGVLDGIWIAAYNGNTAVQETQISGSLLDLRLLAGSTDWYEGTLVIDAPFDRLQIRAGGVVGALQGVDVARIQRIAAINVANPGLPDGTFEICQGAELVLDGDDCGTVYEWYEELTGGTPIGEEGLTFTIPTDWAPGEHTIYVQPKRFGCDFGGRIPVTIVVLESPTADDITIEADEDIYCVEDDVVLTATAADITDPQFSWFFDADKLEPISDGDEVDGATYTIANGELTVTGLAVGDHTYYVSVREGADGCENAAGDLATITITVDETPAPTLTELDQTFCEIDMPTVADLNEDGATGEVVWYTAATGGTPLAADAALTTGTYYAAQIGDNCESVDRTEVEVTITETPAPTLTNLDQIFCEIDMPTVADLNEDGATGEVVWYTAATGGTPLAADAALTTGTYYAAQIGDNCESVDRTEVEVTITETPAPTLTNLEQVFCEIDMPTVADLNEDGATGDAVIWYAAAGGGTPLAATDVLVDGMYYAAQVGDNCESVDRTEVEVTITKTPAPTLTNLDQIFCEIDMPTVASLDTDGATGTVIWYTVATGGTPLAATDVLVDGMYYAAQVGDNCESVDRTEVEVIITKTPAPTLTNLEQTFCEIDMPTVADLNEDGATGTVIWYAAATGGTPLAATDVLVDGMYYAAQVGDNCESVDRTQVEVIITKTPAPTLTNLEQTFCEIDMPTVADLNEDGATGTVIWYAAATGGTPLAVTDVLVDGMYYAAQVGDNCESVDRTEVEVTITKTPAPTLTNLEQTFCEIDMPTVADLNEDGATGEVVWYTAATGGTPLAADAALTAGTYYAAQIGDNCESVDRTAVEVTITETPAPTLTNLEQTFCEIDMPTVADLNEDGATGEVVWYTAATGGTPLAATDVLVDGTYYAAQVGDNCESVDRTEVEVTITETPAPMLTNLDQIFCEIDMPTVASLDTDGATGTVIWYTAATGGTALAADVALTTGTYYAAQIGDNCESVDRTAVEVTITETPAPTLTNLEQTFCEIDMPTVADLNDDGATGEVVWYTAATGGTPLATDAALTTGTYYAAQIGDNCESVDRTAVAVTITETPAPTLTNLEQVFCEIDMPTVADLNEDGATGEVVWYTAATGGTALAADVALTTGTYYAAQIGDNCESVDRTAVTVTITETPAPTIENATPEFCASDNTTLADLPVTGTDIKWYASATSTEVLPATTVLEDGVTYYATQTGDNCESADRLAVTPVITDCASLLSITKTADVDRATAGETISFTLTITNEGPGAMYSGDIIKLGERPSAGLTITGYEVTSGNGTIDGTGNAATVTTTADIAVGGTIILTVTADVDADAPATITNGIDVWGPDKDPETDPKDDDDDTPPIPVDRVSNLSITKVADDARVKAGESTSFTLTITNDGPSVIEVGKAINLTERPGEGVTITGYEVTSGAATVAGDGTTAVLTTTGKIAVGGTIVVSVTADVAANAGETITNGITVWGPDKDPETDPEDDEDDTPPIPVDHEAILSITKVADDARVIAGGSTSFTLTITNDGPAVIASGEIISLVERPGEGVTITGYEVTSDNGTADGSGNTATVTTSDVLAVGGTIVVKVTATVDADAGETITNGIDVWGPDKDPETDPKDDDDDTPPIPVDRVSNLSITKVADDARVKAGESTSFTLTITNDGPSVIEVGKAINLTERPGEGVTITGYEVTSGAATVAGDGNTAVLTTTGKIAVGGTIVVSVTADVAANAGETITNGIDVWGPDKDPETDPKDDEDDTPPIPVDHEAILSITKVADEARVQAGGSTSFTLTITNEGPAVVASGQVISLKERPGAGVTITGYEVTSDNGTADGSGNTATVTTSKAIAVGGTVVVKVTANVAANAGETITNGIDVWGPDKNPETDPKDDDDDTPPIPVDHVSNLSVTKVADDERVIAGGTTSFTVTVTNDGPATIAVGETIAVQERPSDGVAVTGYEVTSGNATVSGTGNSPQLTTTAAIDVGGTITFTVSADVTAPAGSTISNGIAVWGPDKDPGTDEEDDEAETPEIPVDRPYTLSIEKVADQSLVTAGEQTTFTITVTNNGPLDIQSGETIALRERPGTGVSITGYEIISGAATVSGTANSATLTTTGVVGVGATIAVRITADVAETATGTITNGISVWGPDGNPDTDDPDDEDDIDPVPVDATLHIPNVFTPNGDGLNDRFVIKNLLQYQGRELIVINRWGNQVYKSDNYNNDWDGGSLAEGTYYFILRYRNGGDWKTAKGPVAIVRVTNR